MKIFVLSVDEHDRLQFQTFYTFRLHLSNKVSHIVCQLFRYSAHDAYLRLYNNADDESLQVTHFFCKKISLDKMVFIRIYSPFYKRGAYR